MKCYSFSWSKPLKMETLLVALASKIVDRDFFVVRIWKSESTLSSKKPSQSSEKSLFSLPIFRPIFDPLFEADDRKRRGSSIFGAADRSSKLEASTYDLRLQKSYTGGPTTCEAKNRTILPHLWISIFGVEDRKTLHLGSSIPKSKKPPIFDLRNRRLGRR